MSAVIAPSRTVASSPAARTPAGRRLALLGTGTVGRAFVARYQHLLAQGRHLPEFAWLANSRVLGDCRSSPAAALQAANAAQRRGRALPPWAEAEALQRSDVVVDATASPEVADWHAQWLARGVHVVTANKLGAGAQLARAQAIDEAARQGHALYGDSATVGAGLPLLASIRALRAGGDRIHAVEGVLSGSLAWLCHGLDRGTPFSSLLRQAAAAGFTEPDPRVDLSGEDVRRKLLILARAAGIALQDDAVRVESLVPAELRAVAREQVLDRAVCLDAVLEQRVAEARSEGACLRFIGRVDASGASVALRALPLAHPLAAGGGTDNRVAIHSDRYDAQPLLIQGPGAGAGVTAAALLDDVLRIHSFRA